VTHDSPEPPDRPTGAMVRPFLATDTGVGPEVTDVPVTDGAALRPFLLTAGRVTGEDSTIAIETQVITTDQGRVAAGDLGFERRDIVSLCGNPLSVAEIAAQLSLHLAVVRVLVGDLSADGHLSVYLPNVDASTDVDTLLRVIRGLRAIG
jgi:Protein of unknown function (DUF742)